MILEDTCSVVPLLPKAVLRGLALDVQGESLIVILSFLIVVPFADCCPMQFYKRETQKVSQSYSEYSWYRVEDLSRGCTSPDQSTKILLMVLAPFG
eukprot:scaffold5703_cov132-Cylindrotheca_fusiformis.AAC.10